MQLSNEQAIRLIGRQQVQIESLTLMLQELQQRFEEFKRQTEQPQEDHNDKA